MNPWSFLGALAAVRVFRFGVEAALAAHYGSGILRWMKTPTFQMVVGVFIALAVIGTIVSAIALYAQLAHGTRRTRSGSAGVAATPPYGSQQRGVLDEAHARAPSAAPWSRARRPGARSPVLGLARLRPPPTVSTAGSAIVASLAIAICAARRSVSDPSERERRRDQQFVDLPVGQREQRAVRSDDAEAARAICADRGVHLSRSVSRVEPAASRRASPCITSSLGARPSGSEISSTTLSASAFGICSRSSGITTWSPAMTMRSSPSRVTIFSSVVDDVLDVLQVIVLDVPLVARLRPAALRRPVRLHALRSARLDATLPSRRPRRSACASVSASTAA